jgi:hypothetical protein
LVSVQLATTSRHVMDGPKWVSAPVNRIVPRASTLTEPTMSFPFSYQ